MRRLLLALILLASPAFATMGIVNPVGVILEDNGGMPVNLQDQTTPALFIKANKVTNATTLDAQLLVGATTISVASTAGIIAADYLGVFSTATDRFYVGTVLTIIGGDLGMDTPVDSQFEIGDTVGSGITNMAVNGSVTPVVFSIRGQDPGIDATADITRIIITCVDDAAVDLTKFCGSAALTKGIVMRRVDGTTINMINWKTNQDIAGSMYDWTVYAATNPQQGIDGFVSRLTFGGQSKLGVVIRLAPGEELEFLIQDDLTGITSFVIMAEGHIVTD